jgi:hypothetical protein
MLHIFVHVTELTPETVPYYEGRTYLYLLYGWIPRFVWPDKPAAQQDTRDIAVDDRLLDRSVNTTTSIGIGVLAEAYANFAAPGIAVGLGLQGLCLALLGSMLNGPRSDGGRAAYLAIMVYFFNGIGAATAPLFMGVFMNIAAYLCILRCFSSGWTASGHEVRLSYAGRRAWALRSAHAATGHQRQGSSPGARRSG